ncbi:hypothetical protein ACROYT_G022989 [Oculina patagonica]
MGKTCFYSLKMAFALFVCMLNEQNSVFAIQGCSSVVNNSLQSPGYPENYPSDMHCVYSIPIPQGKALNISFHDFVLEDGDRHICIYDYLKITDGKSHTFGTYCGDETGESIVVTGDYVEITFYSDDIEQRKGFVIYFTAVPVALPKVTLTYPVVRTLPGYKLTVCSATGTPPVNTALTRNFTTLVNTTNTDVTIQLYEEGNYTCVATGKYGADVREFSVIFNDCGPRCSYGWTFFDRRNFLFCSNLTSSLVISCAPTATGRMKISSSNLSRIPFVPLSNLINLWHLDLSSNAITFLQGDVFPTLEQLERLILSSNSIKILPDGVFAKLKNLRSLELRQNGIKFLPDRVFATLKNLLELILSSNKIKVVPDGVFANVPYLRSLYLSFNAIQFLPNNMLDIQRELMFSLDLSSNNIQFLHDEMFANMTYLYSLDLNSNAIKFLPNGVFSSLKNLQLLDMNSNEIEFLPDGVFATQEKIEVLDLSFNNIQYLPKDLFSSLRDVVFLFLNNNKLKAISKGTIVNNFILKELLLSDNPIETIEKEAITIGIYSFRIYLLRTRLKILSLESFVGLHGLDSEM